MRLFKATYRDRKGKQRESAKWYVETRDHRQIVRRLPGFTDFKATESLARMLERLICCKQSGEQPDRELTAWLEDCPTRTKTALARWGLIDAAKVAGTKRLKDHIDDFADWIENQGNTAKQAQQQKSRVTRVFLTDCQFNTWSEIAPGRVSAVLADMRQGEKPVSGRTVNFHLQACQQFCRWMIRTRRASSNPIEHLTPIKRDKGEELKRRALTADEVGTLLTRTADEAERFGMPGAARRVLYRLAVESGLRYSEIKSLRVGDFDLAAMAVTIRGEYAKNRREATLPLRVELVELLREHLAGKLPGAPAFDMPDVTKASKMLKADAAAAGISTADEGSGSLCFHSLRHTCSSLLVAAGVHPRTIQSVMRHSTVALTMDRYSHILTGQEAQAINALPDFKDPQDETVRATGTAGKEDDSVLAFCLASKGGKSPDFDGRRRTDSDSISNSMTSEKPALDIEKRGFSSENEGKRRGRDSNPR